ncbi:transporter [Pseudomonas aeruginosa]|nr:transporter [Pseudomonas aeruginosa]MDG3759813.1 transporter [Pseudomonas aeruginosa]MDG4268171.1 transporter [Pseudomonas aeruginosa]RFF61998.1 transporter [Stutzerimonas stutzeri]
MLPSIQLSNPLAPLSLDNCTWVTAWGLVLLISGVSVTSPAAALDLDAGDYVAAPKGTTLGLLYLQAAERDRLYRGGQRQADSPGLDSQIGILRLVHYIELAGYRVAPQLLLPFGRLDGRRGLEDASGLADPVLAMPLWLIDEPERGRYLGVTPYLFLPLGEYDADEPLNLGENRWKLNLQLGYVEALSERLSLDLAADVMFYGRNNQHGSARWTQRQKPSYQYQGFLRYQLTQAVDLRAGVSWLDGGESRVDKLWLDDRQETGKWSLGFSWFFLPKTQVAATYGRDFAVENGFREEHRLNIRLLQVF